MTGCNNKKTVQISEDGTTDQNIEIEKITFDNIKLVYENGITTLTANVNNLNAKDDTFVVTINLKENGTVVKSLQQIIENLDENQNSILQVGIIGDYSYIKDVEFKVEEEK